MRKEVYGGYFTVHEEGWEIEVEEPIDNTITNNKLNHNKVGVHLFAVYKNIVKENTIANNKNESIYMVYSDGNEVMDNNVFSNGKSIFLLGSSSNTCLQLTWNLPS